MFEYFNYLVLNSIVFPAQIIFGNWQCEGLGIFLEENRINRLDCVPLNSQVWAFPKQKP